MHFLTVAMISQRGTPTINTHSPFLKFDLSLEPCLFSLHGILQVLHCRLLQTKVNCISCGHQVIVVEDLRVQQYN